MLFLPKLLSYFNRAYILASLLISINLYIWFKLHMALDNGTIRIQGARPLCIPLRGSTSSSLRVSEQGKHS